MIEKPILFNTEMVRAILDSRKTQTRRPIKPQPNTDCLNEIGDVAYDRITKKVEKAKESNVRNKRDAGELTPVEIKSKYQVGDTLWVRETFQYLQDVGQCQLHDEPVDIAYRADEGWDDALEPMEWQPSIHMPRWASRITLEITVVRAERVQEIGTSDIMQEGVKFADVVGFCDSDTAFMREWQKVWDSIYADKGYGWDANPWVWVYEFEELKGLL